MFNYSAQYFYDRYELAPTPPALFDGQFMRKTNKAAITDMFPHEETNVASIVGGKYVIDGGYLLHALVWTSPATFKEICCQYINFLKKRWPNGVLVFDGYSSERPTTKAAEQQRRSAKRVCTEVEIGPNIHVNVGQADFLSSSKNKAGLIEILVQELTSNGYEVKQAEEDADTLVIRTVFEVCRRNPTVLIGNDTDLLVMLIARTPKNRRIEMLHPATSDTAGKLYKISEVQDKIGDMKDVLLFAHAISGGDKTAAIFRVGKIRPYRLLEKRADLREEIKNSFNKPNCDKKQLEEVAEKFIMALYPDGSKFDCMDKLRYHLYHRAHARQAATASFDLATIAPSKAATQQKARRTYLQVLIDSINVS